VELEVVKGKSKEKESEVVNLEDIIDVKGWKAMGNRLSQYKVTKVKPVDDGDTGLEGDAEEEEAPPVKGKVTEAKGAPSPKKKSEEKPESKPERQKAAPVQANLFGESPQKKAVKSKAVAPRKKGDAKEGKPAVYTPGQTIELEL
jgi:topoisomerase-4 subunit A